MQVVLVMFRDGGERRSFSLTRDTTIIGRREDCDFRIPLGEISRKHCRVIKDDALRVEDLGSSNGTYVNGVRVQEAELQPGDTLKLGSIVFVVQMDGVPAEHEMQPAVAPLSSESSAGGGSVTIDEESHDAHHLNPTAQSEVGDAEGANVEAAAQASGEQSFIITDDAPADSAAGEYDPMSILSEKPEDSSAGHVASNDVSSDEISEDILMDLEAQDHPTKT